MPHRVLVVSHNVPSTRSADISTVVVQYFYHAAAVVEPSLGPWPPGCRRWSLFPPRLARMEVHAAYRWTSRGAETSHRSLVVKWVWPELGIEATDRNAELTRMSEIAGSHSECGFPKRDKHTSFFREAIGHGQLSNS